MRFLTRAGDYVLFEVEKADDEIPGALGRPYYAGTVLLFRVEAMPEIGNEVAWSPTEEDGAALASSLPRNLALELFEFKIERAKRVAKEVEESKSAKDANQKKPGSQETKSGRKKQ